MRFLIVVFLTVCCVGTKAEGLLTVDPSFDVAMDAVATITSLTKQSDGKLLIAGNFTRVNGAPRRALARIHSDGSLDESFRFDSAEVDEILHIAVQSTDKIVCAASGLNQVTLFRVNPDGNVDETFHPKVFHEFNFISILGVDPMVRAVKIQPDDRIIVAGAFGFVDGREFPRIVRLRSDGTLDSSFTSPAEPTHNGFWGERSITDFHIYPDGKLLVSGPFDRLDGENIYSLARLNPDGSLDPKFRASSLELTDPVSNRIAIQRINSITIQDDGMIVLAGELYMPDANDPYDFEIHDVLRLDSDGKLDEEFSDNTSSETVFGRVANAYFLDTKIFVSGAGLTVLKEDGTLDESFNSAVGSDISSGNVLQLDGGDLIFAGELRDGSTLQTSIVRMKPNGELDPGFHCLPLTSPRIQKVKTLESGKILVHGNYRWIDGQPVNWLARLNADGSLDPSFAAEGRFSGSLGQILAHPDGRIFVGGRSLFRNDLRSNGLFVFHPDGTLDAEFVENLGFNSDHDSIEKVVISTNGNVVIFGRQNGSDRIIRFSPEGEPDQTYTPVAMDNTFVLSVAIQEDGGTILGRSGAMTINGVPVENLARITSEGLLDTEFIGNGAPNSSVHELAVQKDGKILIEGSFDEYNGEPVGALIRIHPDGSLDHSFSYNGISLPFSTELLILDNEQILIFDFSLKRLFHDGVLDPFFHIRQPPDSSISDLERVTVRQFLAVGDFREIGGLSRDGIARLLIDDSKVFLTPPEVDGSEIRFRFNSEAERSYSAEFKDSLREEWNPLVSGIQGNNSLQTITDPNPTSARRFYRVRKE